MSLPNYFACGHVGIRDFVLAVLLSALSFAAPVRADEDPQPTPPAQADQAQAEDEAQTQKPQRPARQAPAPLATWTAQPSPVSLDYLPADVQLLGLIRPQGFLGPAEMRVLDTILGEVAPNGRQPVPPHLIEQVSFVMLMPIPERKSPAALIFDLNVLRTKEPVDWKEQFAELGVELKEQEYKGHNYFHAEGSLGVHIWYPDDRTLVVADEGSLQRAMDVEKPHDPHPVFAEAWKVLGAPGILLAMPSDEFIKQSRVMADASSEIRLLANALGGLAKDTQAITMGIEPVEQQMALRIMFACPDAAGAEKRARNLQSLIALVGQSGQGRQQQRTEQIAADPDIAPQFVDYLGAMLSSAQAEQADNFARLTMKATMPAGAAVGFMIDMVSRLGNLSVDGRSNYADAFDNASLNAPAPATPRIPLSVLNSPGLSAARSATRAKLQALATAVQRYVDEHGAYPSDVRDESTGEPLLSWRVRLLPYLDQQELYDQFKLDEPWSSEQNQSLLSRIPDAYRDSGPGRAAGAEGDTTFVAIAGDDTVFGAQTPVTAESIMDGLDRTIMIVQSAPATAWTKPDSAQRDAKNGALLQGGIHPGGLFVVLANGHVLFVASDELLAQERAPYTIAAQDEWKVEPLAVKDQSPAATE